MKTNITHREFALAKRKETIVKMLKKGTATEFIRYYFNISHSRLSQLRKVGKSNVVTVPQTIIETGNLKEGQKLEWKIESGKLVLMH